MSQSFLSKDVFHGWKNILICMDFDIILEWYLRSLWNSENSSQKLKVVHRTIFSSILRNSEKYAFTRGTPQIVHCAGMDPSLPVFWEKQAPKWMVKKSISIIVEKTFTIIRFRKLKRSRAYRVKHIDSRMIIYGKFRRTGAKIGAFIKMISILNTSIAKPCGLTKDA